jgi:hypothetical protein
MCPVPEIGRFSPARSSSHHLRMISLSPFKQSTMKLPAPSSLPILILGLLPFSQALAEWRMETVSKEWHIAGFENALDLSGIARATATQCLVGSDESFYIQPGVINAAQKRIESRKPIALRVTDKPKKAEVDIEGIAFHPRDQAYYVVGSHGVGKKKADFQPDRHSIHQVSVDPATGTIREDGIRQTSLLPWLEKTPQLAGHVKKPLQQNGLNIEGLTVSNDRLFFGLRAPNKNGRALIIEAAPGDLFHGKPGKLKVHEIAIEENRGIREIVAIQDGFIIVTGNASAEASKKIPNTLVTAPDTRFEILFWDGANDTATKIAKLPENGGKAEALLVLEDTESHVDLLVIFDGLPGGEPLNVRLHR